MQRYPLRFRPILKERVWGGRALATRFGREIPPGLKVGEAWEIVDRPADSSVAENGPLAGRTLHELCERHGRELLGANAPQDDRFPLIVKLLDPNDRLSVQVHPTASYVKHHPEAEATKNEMWYAVAAGPGAQIIHGLKEGVTIERFSATLETGQVEPLLRFVPVEAGKFYYIPSGLIHALLPGSLMVEIQQNADTTFRLYDWGRLGLDGEPRTLHVAEAIETAESFLADPALAQYENLAPARPAGGVECVGGLACTSFRVEELHISPGSARLLLDPRSFTVVVSVRGSLRAACVEGAAVVTRLGEGDTALVPAGVEALQVETADGASLLMASLPRLSGTTD